MFFLTIYQFAATQKSNDFSINVLIFTAIVIAIAMAIAVAVLKRDYQRHKRPLQEISPNVDYTFWHHIRVVTIPLLSYRVTFMVQKRK